MRVSAAIFLLAPLAAFAFHIQVGVSGRNRFTGEWVSETVEIGGGESTDAIIPQYESFLLLEFLPFALKQDAGHVGQLGIDTAVTESTGSWTRWVDPAEALSFPDGVGYDRTYYQSPRRSHEFAVVTMRGDPYSVVVNDTGAARTINGVAIPNGGSARLALPLFLVMSQLTNAKFYDVATGDEITPVQTGGSIYHDGAYCLNWTGDIRVTCDCPPHTVTNGEALVYGDMKEANMDKVLHSSGGAPIYGPAIVPTNVTLATWWDFTQDEWGSPQAKINGEVVCAGHSTTHIIPHIVNHGRAFERNGKCSFVFTMSQTPESGKGGGACTFRCWDSAEGSTADGYANCPAEHKASVSGYADTVAAFKVTITLSTGAWKVEPVNGTGE